MLDQIYDLAAPKGPYSGLGLETIRMSQARRLISDRNRICNSGYLCVHIPGHIHSMLSPWLCQKCVQRIYIGGRGAVWGRGISSSKVQNQVLRFTVSPFLFKLAKWEWTAEQRICMYVIISKCILVYIEVLSRNAASSRHSGNGQTNLNKWNIPFERSGAS